MRIKILHLVSLALIVAVAIGATWVWAQEDDTVYYACVNNSSGTIKVFMEEIPCNANEMRISWNRTGPPGPSGLSNAFTTSQGNTRFTSNEPQEQDVVLLDLPKGSFISNITISGTYSGAPGPGFVSCKWDKFVDGVRSPLDGWSVGGTLRLNEQDTFARTFDFHLYDDDGGQVIVYCEPWFPDGADAEIMLNYCSWTVIKVDTIHHQE